MKPVLKAPITKRLKPKSHKLLSSVVFKFNLRRLLRGLTILILPFGPTGMSSSFSLPKAETSPSSVHGTMTLPPTFTKRRNLKLKPKLESSISYYRFTRLIPGGFNMGIIGSTCKALPSCTDPCRCQTSFCTPCSRERTAH